MLKLRCKIRQKKRNPQCGDCAMLACYFLLLQALHFLYGLHNIFVFSCGLRDAQKRLEHVKVFAYAVRVIKQPFACFNHKCMVGETIAPIFFNAALDGINAVVVVAVGTYQQAFNRKSCREAPKD